MFDILFYMNKKKADDSYTWKEILKSRGLLSNKEAEVLKLEMQNFRKGVDFRVKKPRSKEILRVKELIKGHRKLLTAIGKL